MLYDKSSPKNLKPTGESNARDWADVKNRICVPGCSWARPALPRRRAQDYPNRPVTIISPAAAGNSPDVTMRLVADRLTQMWKQQIVMLNRPGAGGLIAAQAAAAPGIEKDGYTLYMTQASTYTVLPITQEGKMPVDLQKAFVPIGLVGVQPIGVAVNAACRRRRSPS